MLNPTSKMKKWCFKGAVVLALLTIGATSAIGFDKFSNMFGTAINGYDTVSYHTEGRAMKGKAEFSYEWNDANWHFASAENRDLFAADPERYAPQFGGLCTGALSGGQVYTADPEAFKIVNGKLYLASSKSSSLFGNPEMIIKKAAENWAKLNK